MSNVQRFRSGTQRVVTGKIQAGVVAEIGDLVALHSNYVLPASGFSAAGAAGTSVAQEAFHDEFLGVLIEGATNGDETTDSDCVVAYTGDYEYDIAALGQGYPPGTGIGAFDAGAVLADQQVDVLAAGHPERTIAFLCRQALSGETTVTVSIASAIMGGGAQAVA